MDPGSIIPMIATAFMGGLAHSTLFIIALVVMAWWIYKEKVWEKVKP